MAARTKRTNLDGKWREKIQTSMLINRLMDNALGRASPEMSPSQVRSAEILLRKSLPDLTTVSLEAGDGNSSGALVITWDRDGKAFDPARDVGR